MIRTALQPQQAAAVEKLLRTRVGAAFMEMGTGKSLVAMTLAEARGERVRRVVWFCPVSLKETVRKEILRHEPDATVHAFDDRTAPGRAPSARYHVVGIESMSASPRVQLAAASLIDDRTMVVLDESTFCKNPRAERTKWITGVSERARYRLVLTGTPVTKGIEDLYAQMRFLDERVLGYRSFHAFAANHLEYHPRKPGLVVRAHNVPWLSAKLAPYVYQVTKAECLDLPPKLHERRWVAMTRDHARLYDLAKETLFAEIDAAEDEGLERVLVYRLFGACRQAACGFWNDLGPLARRGPRQPAVMRGCDHRRLDALMDVLAEIPEGERVVVWAQWLRDVEDIASAIRERHGEGAVGELTGRRTPMEREAALDRFRSGESPWLVAIPSTGGHGLTLVECAYVVFYADGMKASERWQAEDRNHRIGQARPATYVTIGVSGTIDERIAKLLEEKKGLAEHLRETIGAIKDKAGRMQALRTLVEGERVA